MEDDPHRIIEGIIIAAYAIQAHKGYMYIRGEYTEPFEIMQQACEEALSKESLETTFSAAASHSILNFARVQVLMSAGKKQHYLN